VRLDDGTGDGEPHSDSARLRGEERFEQSLHGARRDANPGVTHGDFHQFIIGDLRQRDSDLPVGSPALEDGLDCVLQDVQDDLLELDRAAMDLEWLVAEREPQTDVVPLAMPCDEMYDSLDQSTQV